MASIIYFVYLFFALLFTHPDGLSGTPTAAPIRPIVDLIADPHQEQLAERFESLFTGYATRQGFNGTVLVAHLGKVVYKHAFGYSDLYRKTPLNIESSFQLASVSKQFTAVAIMMLHDEGRLDFSDTVNKFFPDFPYKDITLRELLSHRSGLPNYMYFADKYWDKQSEYLSNAGVMEMLTRYVPKPDFKPNQRYAYSNTGYAVLAAIVEKVSGQSFGDFMNERVFTPLGMKNTFVFNPASKITIPFPTNGYNKDSSPAHDDFLSGVVGDKGVYSTVEDMFKWDQALYTDCLVKQATLEEAFTPLSYDHKHNSNYGYGWRIKMLDGGEKVIYHAGWWKGYNSLYVRRLEDKTSIIVLSNKVNWSFRNIGSLFKLIDSNSIDVTTMGGD
jgi:CubicO group peptidase (beta-lactamase class C family)